MKNVVFCVGVKDNVTHYNMDEYVSFCENIISGLYKGYLDFLDTKGFYITNNDDSIEGTLNADEIVFMDNWSNFDCCLKEEELAKSNNIPIVYLQSNYKED